jgi:hypothetical protein
MVKITKEEVKIHVASLASALIEPKSGRITLAGGLFQWRSFLLLQVPPFFSPPPTLPLTPELQNVSATSSYLSPRSLNAAGGKTEGGGSGVHCQEIHEWRRRRERSVQRLVGTIYTAGVDMGIEIGVR